MSEQNLHPYHHFSAIYEFPNARLMWRNFSGKKDEYNKNGTRSFAIRLSPEDALNLREEGLKVKPLKPSYEGEEDPDWVFPVDLRYDESAPNRDPKVILITKNDQGNIIHTPLSTATIGLLDHSDILCADITVRIYNWTVNGECGRKAYLRNGAFEIYQDLVQRKYGMGLDVSDEEVPF